MINTYVEQKGGNHYQMEYQHWDWCVDMDKIMGYLPCTATKYLERFQKKGTPILDLEKVITYLEKAKLCGQWVNIAANHSLYEAYTEKFLSQLEPINAELIRLVVNNKYDECINKCKELIEEIECGPTANYVDPDKNYIRG